MNNAGVSFNDIIGQSFSWSTWCSSLANSDHVFNKVKTLLPKNVSEKCRRIMSPNIFETVNTFRSKTMERTSLKVNSILKSVAILLHLLLLYQNMPSSTTIIYLLFITIYVNWKRWFALFILFFTLFTYLLCSFGVDYASLHSFGKRYPIAIAVGYINPSSSYWSQGWSCIGTWDGTVVGFNVRYMCFHIGKKYLHKAYISLSSTRLWYRVLYLSNKYFLLFLQTLKLVFQVMRYH